MRRLAFLLAAGLCAPALAQQVPNPMPITGGPGVTPRFGYLEVQRPTTSATDLTDMYLYRDANYVGGTHGAVNASAAFNTTVRAGALPNEWNLYAGVDNYATAADASENAGFYVQSKKRSTGATWGGLAQLLDYYVGPGSANSVAFEINHSSSGVDTANKRIALEIYNNAIPGGVQPVNMRADISLDGVFSNRQYGVEVNGFGANYWGKIVGLSNNAHYGYGIDLTGGTCDFAQFISPAFQVGCNGAVVLGTATPQAAGTINVQTGYYAGDVPGVTCAAGVTAATVRVKNGIVTAC